MSKRQRRHDVPTANAVARGLNILAVRNAELAQRYMAYKGVPEQVIARVLLDPQRRRPLTPEQSVSEAIVPLSARDVW